LEALRKIDPNAVSPREALELLFRLKQLDSGDRPASSSRIPEP
jgi:hypothetical protein